MEPNTQAGIVFDVGSIFARFQTLSDKRKRRGLRYTLVLILLIIMVCFIPKFQPCCTCQMSSKARQAIKPALLGVSSDHFNFACLGEKQYPSKLSGLKSQSPFVNCVYQYV
jgi:hypothetical protein